MHNYQRLYKNTGPATSGTIAKRTLYTVTIFVVTMFGLALATVNN